MSDHYASDFTADDDGFWPGKCECGWNGGLFPGPEDAADALMDHAYEHGWKGCRRVHLPMTTQPKNPLMSCGHPQSSVVRADEGTAYCGKCAARPENPAQDGLGGMQKAYEQSLRPEAAEVRAAAYEEALREIAELESEKRRIARRALEAPPANWPGYDC